MNTFKHLRLNATLVWIFAFLLTITIHEFGHGIAALLMGQHPVVYGVKEQDASGSHAAMAFIAAAGPIVSLVVGLVLLAFERASKLKNIGRQLILTLGLLGAVTFFGYLLTAPFLPSGDVGIVIAALSLPDWARWVCLAVGGYGIWAIGRYAFSRYIRLIDVDVPLRPQFVSAAIMPWLLGTVVLLLVTLPWQYASWPVAVVTAGLFTPLISLSARGKTAVKTPTSGYLVASMSRQGTLVLGAVTLIMIIVEYTVLRSGVHL